MAEPRNYKFPAVPSLLREVLPISAAFLTLAVVLSGVLPFWLDEILQLVETRDTTTSQMIHLLPRHPGAAPLGYLFQHMVFLVAGYSVRLARFPSAFFASGAVMVTAFIGREVGLKKPWVAPALFALFPLTLRYACEARTYATALFFSTLASWLFLRLAKNPGGTCVLLYSLSLTAAVYTQPFAIFVGVAHTVWALLERDRKAAVWSAIAGAIAAISFLPWYLWTKSAWVSNIEGAGVRFLFSPKTPLMLFRELVGGGYWGSGLLSILFIAAMPPWRGRSRWVTLLVLLIVVPSLLAIMADGAFGYFVATRQIMWVLPSVAVLAALGMERMRRAGLAVGVLFAAVCIWQDVRFFSGPKENWKVAADAISAEVSRGACLVVVPAEELRSYAFFRPELAHTVCPAPSTVVAFTPYTTRAEREGTVDALNSEGYLLQSGMDAGGSRIDTYIRQ
jgi:nitrate reductase NapE component